MDLSSEYLIEIFFTYCKRPLHKKYQNVFNAECPICKEGKSAGRVRRLFYFPHKQYFYCHNCARSWKPMEWLKEVTHLSVAEILKENQKRITSSSSNFLITKNKVESEQKLTTNTEDNLESLSLPDNSIDLSDVSQINFYKNNKVVQAAYSYCNERRLFSAINSCNKFYVSLDDKIHKNRLIIPFYYNNKIVSYQSRALFDKQNPKYLTKIGEKEVFNIDNVDCAVPYVFIFEGPIDSMFIKNGLAMAALAPTQKQMQQLNNMVGYEQIYVFDNDKNNKQVSRRIEKHINSGKRIFIWPKEFKKYKDLNQLCCELKMNEIPWMFVVKNSFKSKEALLKYTLAKND